MAVSCNVCQGQLEGRLQDAEKTRWKWEWMPRWLSSCCRLCKQLLDMTSDSLLLF